MLAAGVSTAIHPLTTHAQKERSSSGFVHPGMLHSKEDCLRMKSGVRERVEPILSGYEVFRRHPQSQANYAMQGPFAEIGRNPTVNSGNFDSDANAAYQCAIMWNISGDEAYAETSRKILNAWSGTLKRITGADAVLCAGLGGFKLLNAAELLRYTYSRCLPEEIASWQQLFRGAILPVLENFAPFANGNWDTAAIKTLMAIGIFCDDRDIFERGLCYYLYGCGDGRITNYIYQNGQCQESGRDQQHTQLGLAHMGDCCEMAWHQGVDLYAAYDDLLLKGFEYTAKYNIGQDVPFHPDRDRTGKYAHAKISPRGPLRPVYEQIYNHYVHRRGVSAPFTQKAAESIRPEGPAQGADHPGFGTLLFSRTEQVKTIRSSKAVEIGGVRAAGTAESIQLTWAPLVQASGYTVLRSSERSGQYRTVAQHLSATVWHDNAVVSAKSYFYQIRGEGSRAESPVVGAVAGLPANWEQASIGDLPSSGTCFTDGDSFEIEASGSSALGASDHFHFVYQHFVGDFSFRIRLLPLVASQFLSLGLIAREDKTDDTREIALMVSPQVIVDKEHPQWIATVATRVDIGKAIETIGRQVLEASVISYGRIVNPIWFSLERTGGDFHAAISSDGETWTPVGKAQAATLPQDLLVGMFVCSGLGDVPTQVVFDNCEITKSR